jgi:HD-GYP domain-containing protein (c-di-GMP phosphodiesterase class II)
MVMATLLTQELETHDPDSAGHGARVTELALRIAQSLRAGAERLEAIRAGGPVHDVGKLGVDAAILGKPGALAPDELAEIRAHPVLGVRMLDGLAAVRHGLECVLHHHERWDGTGYPHGLRGDEIPLEARVIAVADAYDAMTTDRPYRRAMTWERTRAELVAGRGTQWDVRVVDAFIRMIEREVGAGALVVAPA